MEKLIELLNEYDDNNWGVTDYGALFNRMNEGISETEYLQVISKRFGFIQRLVRENKIDIGSQAMQYVKSDLSKFFTEWKDKNGMSDDCTMLLMLLAIQENPISFLISVLK